MDYHGSSEFVDEIKNTNALYLLMKSNSGLRNYIKQKKFPAFDKIDLDITYYI
jgi:DNA-dependent RNA polymerase auxiliary subunit epsilon